MNTDLVRYRSEDPPRRRVDARPALAPSYYELAAPVRAVILGGRRHLEAIQRPDGSWAGRQLANTSQTIELALLLSYLGRKELAAQAVNAVLADQSAEGAWSWLPNGAVDVSISVQAYLALKVSGYSGSRTLISRARQAIRSHGGADAADTATRLWLALFGQVSHDVCQGIHRSRLEPAAAAVICSRRPQRKLDAAHCVRELFITRPQQWNGVRRSRNHLISERVQWAEVLVRKAALRDDTRITRFDELVWLMVALDSLGLSKDSDEMIACEARLQKLLIVDDECDQLRPQPTLTPVVDTALALGALREGGAATSRTSTVGVRWLADQCRRTPRIPAAPRRWVSWKRRPQRRLLAAASPAELAGLLSAFSSAEDAKDDAVGALPPNLNLAIADQELMADRVRFTSRRRLKRLANEAAECLLRFQNTDGGWTTDGVIRNRRGSVLRLWTGKNPWQRPRCDSAADVTGAVLAAFDEYGLIGAQAAIARAVDFLRAAQLADGSWASADGTRCVEATSSAIRGLIAAGLAPDDEAVVAGVQWLLLNQKECGGWSEKVEFDAPSSAPTTALALLALVVAGAAEHAAIRRGIQFLVDSQAADGTWLDAQVSKPVNEESRPNQNELHSAILPLQALARWAIAAYGREESGPPQLTLLSDDSPA